MLKRFFMSDGVASAADRLGIVIEVPSGAEQESTRAMRGGPQQHDLLLEFPGTGLGLAARLGGEPKALRALQRPARAVFGDSCR